MKKTFQWKLFFILWGAAVFGIIAVLPYTLTLQSAALQAVELPIPLPALLAIQVVQNAIMFAVLTALGLFFANRTGLGAPILEAKLEGQTVAEKVRSILPVSLITGVLAGVVIIGLDVFVFQAALVRALGYAAESMPGSATAPSAWQGFLASFYGGIAEEILLRLFMMSLLVWLGSFIGKTAEGAPAHWVFWAANILATILFGLGHLPATSAILPLTPLVITRAIILNGIGGVAFGWLYWKRGLESAMVAHFTADIVLHVIFAL